YLGLVCRGSKPRRPAWRERPVRPFLSPGRLRDRCTHFYARRQTGRALADRAQAGPGAIRPRADRRDVQRGRRRGSWSWTERRCWCCAGSERGWRGSFRGRRSVTRDLLGRRRLVIPVAVVVALGRAPREAHEVDCEQIALEPVRLRQTAREPVRMLGCD